MIAKTKVIEDTITLINRLSRVRKLTAQRMLGGGSGPQLKRKEAHDKSWVKRNFK